MLEDCHHSLFRQFRIGKSRVRSVLSSLDVTKSIGDKRLSTHILKFCAQSLSGPLTSLFHRICQQSIFPASWKISCVAPVYRLIVVLPVLLRIFEIPQLRRHIDPFITQQQFSFMKASSTSDAGISLASTIIAAINQKAEARLVILDIKGAFDSVWWRGLLMHLRSIGFRDRALSLFES